MILHQGPGWNDLIRPLPGAHLLQTEQWGAFKQRSTGWTPGYYRFHDADQRVRAAALILTRRIGPLAVMYIPKGPMLDYTDEAALQAVLRHLQRLAARGLAIQIKIDPEVPLGTGVPGESDAADHPLGIAVTATLRRLGWRESAEQIQFRNTITLDITPDEATLLAAMGAGKRRKVRYGPRHGVTVRAAGLEDLPILYRLYAETGRRNGFVTRPYDYYIDEWGTLLKAGMGHALIAEVNGQPVAQVILFRFGERCLYFTGASVSDNEVRRLMPADLLQWEAIRWAKNQGCTVYDFWGAPTHFAESDPMWGVFQFKRDFGGQVLRHIGAWDYAPYPPLYALYTQVMPRVLNLMRRRAARKTSGPVESPE